MSDLSRIAATGDPIANWQRDIIGQSVRIHLPLRDVISLREYATTLRVLASALEVLSHDTKRPDFSVLFEARAKIKLADNLIRKGRSVKE